MRGFLSLVGWSLALLTALSLASDDNDLHSLDTPTVSGAIAALNMFFNETTGTFDDRFWFNAIATNVLVNYATAISPLGNDILVQAVKTVELNKGVLSGWPSGDGNFRADSTDDTGWWALAILDLWEALDYAGTEFVEIAVLDEAYMLKWWTDTPCGGGIWWNVKDPRYKNTISNALYVKLAARLYNLGAADLIPEKVLGGGGIVDYLSRAKRAWEWIHDSGIINSDSLLNDGVDEIPGDLNRACKNNRQPTWTYNQGVAIGALVELHKADGAAGHLDEAVVIADAVLRSTFLAPGGILLEPCDNVQFDCSDHEQFKGIFMRELVGLAKELDKGGSGGGKKYWDFIIHNSNVMVDNSRVGDSYGYLWQGPYNMTTVATQTSAANLLIAQAAAFAQM